MYLRGRSAVLGNPSPKVVAELFGIFPHWLFEVALPPATEALDAPAAVRAYSQSSAAWARVNLSDAAEPGRGRLLRTAWSEEATDALIAAAEAKGDLRQRWQRAEHLTDQRVAELLDATFTQAEQEELRRRLNALVAEPALLS